MKIHIKDFGPISDFELDLSKDLHLIYGQNAIGKSYAAYCIYSLLKNVKNKKFRFYYRDVNSVNSSFEKEFENVLKKTKDNIGLGVNVTALFAKLIDNTLKNVLAEGIKNSFLNSFSSLSNLKNRYSNKPYNIELIFDDKSSIYIKADSDGNPLVSIDGINQKLEITEKNTKTTRYSFSMNKERVFASSDKKRFLQSIHNVFIDSVNQILEKLDYNIRDVYYLPASRSGLYQALNSFTPILAELTQNRFFLNSRSFQLPALSEPLSDYFIDLSTLSKKNINKELLPIAEEIEKEILGGEITYNQNTNKIIFKPYNIKLELDVSESSSMVAELSPIVLYLKHIINNKFQSTKSRDVLFYDPFYQNKTKKKGIDIIFIEEPEAHLHPDIQVKLMIIFAKLSKMGIKIIITSHSNYMFYQLNNLIMSDEISYLSIGSSHLVRSKMGSVVNPEMHVTKDGIPDDNFEQTIKKLYEERLNIEER